MDPVQSLLRISYAPFTTTTLHQSLPPFRTQIRQPCRETHDDTTTSTTVLHRCFNFFGDRLFQFQKEEAPPPFCPRSPRRLLPFVRGEFLSEQPWHPDRPSTRTARALHWEPRRGSQFFAVSGGVVLQPVSGFCPEFCGTIFNRLAIERERARKAAATNGEPPCFAPLPSPCLLSSHHALPR